ncbi:small secreted protein [Armillaria gallica]|uniref:NADH dehydrogenase [ubiquinone] 1 alpha subcomplex subunit 1 n=1 Tax=Armillaria gallica TaxID=47427 RepID=A0A2H3DF87_ARMGA|nr:small secreted protein [Armillaria gallica]
MPVPWEAVLPFAIATVMISAAGTLFSASQRFQNLGKPPRYGIDSWDEMMMRRDKLLTGHVRGQSDNPISPSIDDLRRNLRA